MTIKIVNILSLHESIEYVYIDLEDSTGRTNRIRLTHNRRDKPVSKKYMDAINKELDDIIDALVKVKLTKQKQLLGKKD